MPFHLIFGRDKTSNSSKKKMWECTQQGMKQIDIYWGQDTPQYSVLVSLGTLGMADVETIANDVHLSAKTVDFHLRQLKGAGFTQEVNMKGSK